MRKDKARKKSDQTLKKDALVDEFIRVMNKGRGVDDVQAALTEALALFTVQSADKPYEALETVIDELRDSFYDEAERSLESGDLTVTSTARLDSLRQKKKRQNR